MYPSSIKLVLGTLSLSDMRTVRGLLEDHRSGLKAIILNKNFATLEPKAWTQDLELTEYMLKFLDKCIKRRTETVVP